MSSAWPEPPNYYDAPKHGFKVTLENPTYPIINPDPNITDAGAAARWQTARDSPLVAAVARGATPTLMMKACNRPAPLPLLCVCSDQHAHGELVRRGGPRSFWLRGRVLLW